MYFNLSNFYFYKTYMQLSSVFNFMIKYKKTIFSCYIQLHIIKANLYHLPKNMLQYVKF